MTMPRCPFRPTSPNNSSHCTWAVRAVAAVILLGACHDGPVGPKSGPGSNVTGIVIQTPPITMTGPGVARARVVISLNPPLTYPQVDTTRATISATGPFTATWEIGPVDWRALNIAASGPGTGSITVTAGGKSASINLTAVSVSFKSVDLSDGYGCGIALDDTAWCWGANDYFQLGTATVGQCNGGACQYGGNKGNATPLPVDGGRKFTQLATGGHPCEPGFIGEDCGTTCGLTAAATVWCWGEDFNGASVTGMNFKFVAVKPGATLAPGGSKECGLTTDGQAYCFTASATTAIGNGMVFTSLSVGATHSCGVDGSGDVYCWGNNTLGALGTGAADTASHPNPVRAVTAAKFSSVDVGLNSTCALATTATLYCWGLGYSATGTTPPSACAGTTICQTSPRAVEGSRTYASFSRSDASSDLCGLAADGSVDCWKSYNVAPLAVAVPEPLTNVSVGLVSPLISACGVSASHTLYCWANAGPVTKLGQ
jgi:hypothetical protein